MNEGQLARHGHGLLHGAQIESHVHAHGLGAQDADTRQGVGDETGLADGDVVDSGLKLRDGIGCRISELLTFVSENVTQNLRISDTERARDLCSSRVAGHQALRSRSLRLSESRIESHFFEVPVVQAGSCTDERIGS